MPIIYENGRYKKMKTPKRGTVSKWGIIRGKVVKISSKLGIFFQVDKNSQICDIYRFDKSLPKEERIGERIRGRLYEKYIGRPLYSSWAEILKEAW